MTIGNEWRVNLPKSIMKSEDTIMLIGFCLKLCLPNGLDSFCCTGDRDNFQKSIGIRKESTMSSTETKKCGNVEAVCIMWLWGRLQTSQVYVHSFWRWPLRAWGNTVGIGFRVDQTGMSLKDSSLSRTYTICLQTTVREGNWGRWNQLWSC